MQGKVELAGMNTAKLKVLPQVEMDALLRRAKEGDESARQKLIEGNLRLVLSVIQRFDKRGESPDDLFQVGCIGLIKAIENFDPTKMVRFSTYGVPMTMVMSRRFFIIPKTLDFSEVLGIFFTYLSDNFSISSKHQLCHRYRPLLYQLTLCKLPVFLVVSYIPKCFQANGKFLLLFLLFF